MIPAPRPQLDDESARRRIRESLGESLLVEASAGTGKTSELVRRITRVIEAGLTTIDRIAAVTFTNKAAGELKLRLRQELDQARGQAAGSDHQRSLEHAVAHLEEASIGTIHSFCAQILRERPVEAVVDPAFEELSEQEASRLYERAFRRWLEKKLGEGAPGLRRAFTRLAWRESWETWTPIEQLQAAGRQLVEWRDYRAPWEKIEFAREATIDLLVREAVELARLSGRCARANDSLAVSLRPAREFAVWVERAEAVRSRDYDTLETLLVRLFVGVRRNFRKGRGPYADGLSREEVQESTDRLLQALADFRAVANAALAGMLREEMRELVDGYGELKRRAGRLDFVDQLILSRNLLRDNRGVRSELQSRFSHLFIDEFQDTDPLQVEILLLLAADDPDESDWRRVRPAAGKLFVVGDPKQSIYKFRRADVTLYQSVRRALVERGAGLVRLARSFRAARGIQQCINAAFEPEMSGEPVAGQADYVPLEEYWPGIAGQPCVVALPVPRPYANVNITGKAIDASLPEATAAFIDWLVGESGWQVRDLEDPGRLVALAARHVCVLFRRFTQGDRDVSRDYVRALEARGIPHLVVGSKSFHQREEVETLRVALSAIEWPQDELAVFATLKGSLFAIADETLLRFHHQAGRLHPFLPLAEPAEEFQPAMEALRLLADLHRERNRRPIAETIQRLLESTRAHAGFALRPTGRQVLANVSRVCDLARAFERHGGVSFRGFVEELEAQVDHGETAEAPVLEEGADGVRLMTVHKAKGLEFPVVVLADMSARLRNREPDRYIDGERELCAMRLVRCAPKELHDHERDESAREEAEGVRVAYVAVTRARDLLVVPVTGDQEWDGWLGALNKALYPAPVRRRQARPAPGCPRFGPASVLNGPMQSGDESSVRPGLHTPRVGEHEVVWWDPALLRLRVEENLGLRQQQILAGEPESRVIEGVHSYEQWRAARDSAVLAGGRRSVEVFAASEAGQPPAGFRCEVREESLPPAADRPGGGRFGTFVHALLRDVPLDGGAAEVARLARLHGRLLGAPEEEIAAAGEAVATALRHPLLARARAADALHREFPVMARLDDGRMLEGILDLAFLERGTWHIVDFKSDAGHAERRARYHAQLQWYGLALARATGRPVEAWLLGV